MALWKSVLNDPKGSSPTANAGFWCAPIGGDRAQSFFKLWIEPSILNSRRDKSDVDGSRAEVAWTIVETAEKLTQHWPLLSKIVAEVRRSYGADVLEASADKARQQAALRSITAIALKNGWVYVLPESDEPSSVVIGCDGVPGFARALYDHLTGNVFADRETRVTGVECAIVVHSDGRSEPPRSLAEILTASGLSFHPADRADQTR